MKTIIYKLIVSNTDAEATCENVSDFLGKFGISVFSLQERTSSEEDKELAINNGIELPKD